ncbi:MAG TPA: 3'-5' exonuclease, partial [Chroococcales cyanobacterium]
KLFETIDDFGAKSVRQSEGAAVANWISQMIADGAQVSEKSGASRDIRFGDFAILVQRNRDFQHLETALATAGIPYVTLGGKGFLERQEIYDMENLLTFLFDPNNDHALVGVLRSPIFALTDDLIHNIGDTAVRPRYKSLWRSLREMVIQRHSGHENYAPAYLLLRNWIGDADRLPVSDLLRKIILSTSYDLVLMALPNGHQRSRNLWKLVWLAAERQDMSCAEFANGLKLMRKYNVKQSDAPLDTGNAVKLMTIHSSKGLEFPAVALPVLNTTFRDTKRKLFFHRDYGIALNTTRDTDDRPASFEIARLMDGEMELAEKRRLLYVAMTRARDHLALFAEQEPRKTESFRSWLSDLVDLSAGSDESEWQGIIKSGKHVGRFQGAVLGFVKVEQSKFDPVPDEEEAFKTEKLDLIDRVDEQTNTGLSDPVRPLRLTPVDVIVHPEATVMGTFFHSLMEHLSVDVSLPSDEAINSLAFALGDVAAHPAVSEALVREGKRLLDIFMSSELAGLLRHARKRFHEVPCMTFANEQSQLRRPDLLFQDANGRWLLVDFKTDHFELSTLENQVNSHRSQLGEYVRHLRKITGLSAVPHLYFAQYGKLVLVSGG